MISFVKLFQRIRQNIHLSDIVSLKRDLRYLPIETLSDKAVDKLLGTLAELSLESAWPEKSMREIIDRWLNKTNKPSNKPKKKTVGWSNQEDEVEGTNVTFFDGAFYNINVSIPALKLMAKILDYYTFSRLVSNITEVMYDIPGHNIDYGLKRMELVYTNITRLEVKLLLLRAKEKNNYYVKKYLRELIRRAFDPVYAPIPAWILKTKNIPNAKDLKLKTLYSPIPATPKQLVVYTRHAVGKESFDLTNTDDIIKQYQALDNEERQTLFTELQRTGHLDDIIPAQTQEEIERFKIYGPSNPVSSMTKQEYELNYDSMFVSPYLNYEDDFEDEQVFDGWCWECDKAIQYLHYSFRAPMDTGGWLGWFCNVKCAEDWIYRRFEGDEDDYKSTNIVRLIIRFKTLLLKYKIYERKYVK